MSLENDIEFIFNEKNLQKNNPHIFTYIFERDIFCKLIILRIKNLILYWSRIFIFLQNIHEENFYRDVFFLSKRYYFIFKLILMKLKILLLTTFNFTFKRQT